MAHKDCIEDEFIFNPRRAGLLRWRSLVFGVGLCAASLTARAEDPPPSLELLEYLGSLEQDEEGWFGPEELARQKDLAARSRPDDIQVPPPEEPKHES